MFAAVSRRFAPVLAQATTALQTASFASTRLALKPPDPQAVPMSKLYDSFLDGTSSSYLEELERRYNEDPGSVDKTWAGFFRHVGALSTTVTSLAATWTLSCRHHSTPSTCRQRDPAGVHLGGVPCLPVWQDTICCLAAVSSGAVQPDHPGVHALVTAHPRVPGAACRTWRRVATPRLACARLRSAHNWHAVHMYAVQPSRRAKSTYMQVHLAYHTT